MKFSSKAITLFFFKPDNEEEKLFWRCNKCYEASKKVYKQDLSKGYSNLISHVEKCIGKNYLEQMETYCKEKNITLDQDGNLTSQRNISSFYQSSEKESRAFTWMTWVVIRNMPLSEIDNSITRRLGKAHGRVSSKTMRRWIIATAFEVEKKIVKELKNCSLISLIHDGWECDGTSTSYTAIVAAYKHPVKAMYTEVLLAIQPLLSEADLGADSHIELFESTMMLYGIGKEKLIALIGDK